MKLTSKFTFWYHFITMIRTIRITITHETYGQTFTTAALKFFFMAFGANNSWKKDINLITYQKDIH